MRVFPFISKAAGFVAYYDIETDEGGWASVSVFGTPSGDGGIQPRCTGIYQGEIPLAVLVIV